MKRPWGYLQEVIARLEKKEQWDIIGAVSFEERCTGAQEVLYESKSLRNKLIFKINDPPSGYTDDVIRKTNTHINNFRKIGALDGDIYEMDLLDPAGIVVAKVREFIDASDGNLILDISSLPKRFFFPCLKLALASPKIRNLISAYSIPLRYTSDTLASDTDPMSSFPLFSSPHVVSDEPEIIIIGVGYLPFDLQGLRQQLSGKVPTKVIFPFPPGPPSFQRNWQFLMDIFGENQSESIPEPIRVDARDASYAFDIIDDLTLKGKLGAYLLPFGPKPHSLAMALHCLRSQKDHIFYTQPKAYHYDYSIGIKRIGELPEVYGYCIKLNSKNLYE